MSQNLEKTLFQKRRKVKHRSAVPWYKRLGLRLEEYNKRLTLGLIGKLLGTKNIAKPLDLGSINSVLILRYDAIGDMVVTTPFWRILKKHAPHIKIGVVCSLRNRSVLNADPDVDEIFDFAAADTKAILRSLSQTRSTKWDICLQTVYLKKTKGAIVARLAAPGSLTSILAHDKIERYKKLFSIVGISPQHDPQGQRTHMLEHLRVQFETVFDYKPSQEEWHPSIMIEEATLESVRSRLNDLIGKFGAQRVVVLNTEAQTPFKEWGYENANALAHKMQQVYPDCVLLLIASPNTRPALEEYLRTHQRPRNMQFFPTDGIQEVMALVRYSDLVISPDTSLIHIATAERKPTVAVYLRPNEWVPYHVPYEVVSPETEAPVSTVSVDRVLQAMMNLLPQDSKRSSRAAD